MNIEKRAREMVQTKRNNSSYAYCPLILLVAFSAAIFLVVSQVQKQQEDLRVRQKTPKTNQKDIVKLLSPKYQKTQDYSNYNPSTYVAPTLVVGRSAEW